MTTLYIHIGTSKTATSTLQVFFRENAAKLEAAGVSIPRSVEGGAFSSRPISHHLLAWSLTQANQRPPGKSIPSATVLIHKLISEVRDAKSQQNYLITSEAFFSPHCHPQELAELLEHMEVKIVVYLRRQDDWLEANYATNIMMPYEGADSMQDFVRMSASSIDYASMLEPWASVFGDSNIIVRPFDRSRLVDSNIVSDFLSVMGVENSALQNANVKSFNTRLGALSLVVLKRLKPHCSDTEYRSLVRQIVKMEKDGTINNPVQRFISPRQRHDLMSSVAPINEIVRSRYAPTLAAPLFADDAQTYDHFDEQDVSEEHLLDLLRQVLLSYAEPTKLSMKEHFVE